MPGFQVFNIYMHGAEPKALSPYFDPDLLTQNIQAATTVHVMLIAPFLLAFWEHVNLGAASNVLQPKQKS